MEVTSDCGVSVAHPWGEHLVQRCSYAKEQGKQSREDGALGRARWEGWPVTLRCFTRQAEVSIGFPLAKDLAPSQTRQEN